jgi:hypothetical protein
MERNPPIFSICTEKKILAIQTVILLQKFVLFSVFPLIKRYKGFKIGLLIDIAPRTCVFRA